MQDLDLFDYTRESGFLWHLNQGGGAAEGKCVVFTGVSKFFDGRTAVNAAIVSGQHVLHQLSDRLVPDCQ